MRASTPDKSVSPTPAPLLGPRWWVPSAFAILALLLLLVVPAVVDKRIGKVRGQLTLSGDSARVLVNDLEASFASQLLVRNGSVSPETMPAFASHATLDADNAALRDVVRELGPQAMPYYNDLSGRLHAWDASTHEGSIPTAQQGLQLLASAERLDSILATMAGARRVEVQRLERIDVITPAILSPVALIAIIIVMWAGRRTVRFAHIAEEERARVVRAGEARAALLRGVTHDVKNPLGAATGYAQLLEDGVVGPVPAPQLEMVRHIHRLVNTAVQTISDLLQLAEADGKLHVQYAATDLAPILEQVVDDHRGMAGEHSVEVVVAAQPTSLMTDPLRVREVLANLLSNAIKYTPQGGVVRVSIVESRRASERARIGVEVRDTGPGIPTELHEKIFEEFFRVRDNGAKVESGNGLGLAISRRIARLLGGDVTVADAEGGGAVFTLWLPSSQVALQPRERPATPALSA